jgi:opacity protein-like surface antigen
MMRKIVAIFAVGLGCLAASTSAQSADRRAPVFKAPQPAPVVTTWQGFYIGGHLGYGRARWDGLHESDDAPGFITSAADLGLRGVLGGFQAGYNWQFANWIIGAEADISWTRWRDTEFDAADMEDFITGRVKNLYSIRGRVGMPSGNMLFYGTGGIAWTRAVYTATDEDSGVTGTVKFSKSGWVFGGGIEAMLASNMTARVEALHYIFDRNVNTAGLTPESPVGDFVKFRDATTVRLALNYYWR